MQNRFWLFRQKYWSQRAENLYCLSHHYCPQMLFYREFSILKNQKPKFKVPPRTTTTTTTSTVAWSGLCRRQKPTINYKLVFGPALLASLWPFFWPLLSNPFFGSFFGSLFCNPFFGSFMGPLFWPFPLFFEPALLPSYFYLRRSRPI